MSDQRETAGFAVLDNKGRLALPKAVRSALNVAAGSAVAYVVAGDTLLVVPQDRHLADLMERASNAVAGSGLTAQDYIGELPAVRDGLLRAHYTDEFIGELREAHSRAEAARASEQQSLRPDEPFE